MQMMFKSTEKLWSIYAYMYILHASKSRVLSVSQLVKSLIKFDNLQFKHVIVWSDENNEK